MPDSFWNFLKAWGPVARDIFSLGLAGLGSYLAYLAIKMGKEQGQIAKRQANIAEKQHQILQEQLEKRPDIRVRAEGQNRDGFDEDGPTVVRFTVMNGGTRSADGCYWEILIAREHVYALTFIDDDDNEIKTKFMPLSETESCDRVDGVVGRKLYLGDREQVIRMRVDVRRTFLREFQVMWRVKHDEGIVPADGFARIHFQIEKDKFYSVKHDDPSKDVYKPICDVDK